MAFRHCQHEDPFSRQVRQTYGANVVGAPRAGIEPLDVLAVRKRRVEPRGRLRSFIASPDGLRLPVAASRAAAGLTGLRSAAVDLEVAAALTSNFLAALGVPVPGTELKTTLWQGASALNFEVRDVQERQVDIGALGRALTGRSVERASPASAVFFADPEVRMLIITRTLTSSDFTVHSHTTSGQALNVSVDAIAQVIGRANADVTFKRETDNAVSFHGKERVTFAFAAVPCVIQPNGSFYFGVEADDIRFGVDRQPDGSPVQARPIIDEDGLLELDTV